jgi:hypothetical protein
MLVERCAGLDVHKDSVTACVRAPDGHGGRHAGTRSFTTTTAGLVLLGEWLASFGVTRVGMESTGCDWKPVRQLLEDYNTAREAEDLPVDAATVLMLRNAGPKGYPGMPEAGNLPLPRKLLQQGVTDMVRVSDARMSGTGYGTVVLHVAPEAALGGPLALVQTGDWVELDVPARTLRMEVDDQELGRRRQQWQPVEAAPARGYARLYVDHVLQANQGADLDFLVGASGHQPPRHNH